LAFQELQKSLLCELKSEYSSSLTAARFLIAAIELFIEANYWAIRNTVVLELLKMIVGTNVLTRCATEGMLVVAAVL
jgi:hypothetical protein